MRRTFVAVFALLFAACGSSNGKKPNANCTTNPSDPSCVKPQCSDGIDNDGDGLIDYPEDPGCYSPNADSEVDDCPDGPNCPECANGKDDDGNGYIDYSGGDPGCTAAGDPDEYTFDVFACGGGTQVEELPFNNEVTGMFQGGRTGALMGKCGGAGDLHVYLLHLKKPRVVVATTDTGGTSADTVLYIRSANCPDTNSEVVCDDNISSTDTASTVTAALDTGTYYLVMQAKDSSVSGTFDLQVMFFSGEGTPCTAGGSECGPGLVCRVPMGQTALVCSKPMCSDGVDNDGDGKIDYPNDPGCDSPSDNDETDDCPSGPNCPECGNNIDDNNNGKTDYPAEPNCIAASTSSEWCAVHENVVKITTPTTMGDTTTAVSDFQPTCAFDMNVPDLTYRLDLPALNSLSIGVDTGGAWYPAIELLDHTCTGTALQCSNSSIALTNVAAQTYFLVVDGDTSTDHGSFTVTVAGDIKTGQSCEGALAVSGALVCEAGSLCKGAAGSRTCQKALCNDGIDNDGDGKIDYPLDPGCSSPDDDTESPNPSPLPQCANTTDDDADTKIDYANDLSCWAASGNDEGFCNTETDRVLLIYSPTHTGTTVGAHGNYTPSCQSSTSLDLTYALVLPVPVATLTIDTAGSAFDTVLAVTTRACTSTAELGCNDDSIGVQSQVTLTNVAAGTYAVVVDGYSTNSGAYTLHTKGTVAAGTACTDLLFTTGVLVCPTGMTCTAGTCQ
jgi:hypothetical protein